MLMLNRCTGLVSELVLILHALENHPTFHHLSLEEVDLDLNDVFMFSKRSVPCSSLQIARTFIFEDDVLSIIRSNQVFQLETSVVPRSLKYATEVNLEALAFQPVGGYYGQGALLDMLDCSSLKSLNIRNFEFRFWEFCSAQEQMRLDSLRLSISNLIEFNRNLKKIWLPSCNEAAFHALFLSLKQNTTLEELYMDNSTIGEGSMTTLSEAMLKNNSLLSIISAYADVLFMRMRFSNCLMRWKPTHL
jgi:hypothetical protein